MTHSINGSTNGSRNNHRSSVSNSDIIDLSSSEDDASQGVALMWNQRFMPVTAQSGATAAAAASVQSIRNRPQESSNLERATAVDADDKFGVGKLSENDLNSQLGNFFSEQKKSEEITQRKQRSNTTGVSFWKVLKDKEPDLYDRHYTNFASKVSRVSLVRLDRVLDLLKLDPRPAYLNEFLNRWLSDFIEPVANAGTNYKHRDQFLADIFNNGPISEMQGSMLVDGHFKDLLFPKIRLPQEQLHTLKALFNALEESNGALYNLFVRHKGTIYAIASEKSYGSYTERALFLSQLAIRISNGDSVRLMAEDLMTYLTQPDSMVEEIKKFLLSSGFDASDLPDVSEYRQTDVDALVQRVYQTLSRRQSEKEKASPFAQMVLSYTVPKLPSDARDRFIESIAPLGRSMKYISPMYSKQVEKRIMDDDYRKGHKGDDRGEDKVSGRKRKGSELASMRGAAIRQVNQRTFFDSPLFAAVSHLSGISHLMNSSSGMTADEMREMVANLLQSDNRRVLRDPAGTDK